jgi:CHAT domain-containing protein
LSILFGIAVMVAIAIATIPIPWSPAPATVTRARIPEIEQTWQSQYTDYFGTTPGSPLTVDEINATLKRLNADIGRHLALVYIFPQLQELELILVIPNRQPLRKTFANVPQATLLPVVTAFQTEMLRPLRFKPDLTAAQQLYRWFLSPFAAELQAAKVDALVFCVGAGLRSLPFVALHDGQQFLIEKYSLSLIPAFTLTQLQHDRLHKTQVLAMGASEFTNLNALPAVPLELDSVKAMWQSNLFLNQDFTLDNLKQQLSSQDYAIVHLATHAQFKPGDPSNSFIQLWQEDQLNLSQIQQLNWKQLPVELLVLSACQTAVGDPQAELGFAGLSFHAGVKSTLASLWQVSDIGTLGLMREFYWQLAQPEVTIKAEALQRAQLAMLKGQVRIENQFLYNSSNPLPLTAELTQSQTLKFSQPYYWAGFTLVGSPW